MEFIDFVRHLYKDKSPIALHEPTFDHREQEAVKRCIDSSFVSSVGHNVNEFENAVKRYSGASFVVATVNGTAALHLALKLAGVCRDDLVITQALTFVATCNAISYLGAEPIFIDITRERWSLDAAAVKDFLQSECVLQDNECIHLKSGKVVKAILPVHTFGHPADMEQLIRISKEWNLRVVEDAAESLGSLYQGQHTGTFGDFAALSFNGNKIITTGGGGMVMGKDSSGEQRAKHLSTTARVEKGFHFYHDEVGFNYRLPNLNAALGIAQMEKLDLFIEQKRKLATYYQGFFARTDFQAVREPEDSRSNYWLNTIVSPNPDARDHFLRETNSNNVMCRPVWDLMCDLPMFAKSIRDAQTNAKFAQAHLINIPSSPIGF